MAYTKNVNLTLGKRKYQRRIVFEMELVEQVEVNINYILMLVLKYHADNCQDKTILVSIEKAINSSAELRSKKELIEGFIKEVISNSDVDKDWKAFVQKQKETDLALIIADENLNGDAAQKFMETPSVTVYLKPLERTLTPSSHPCLALAALAERKKGRVLLRKLWFFQQYFRLRK